MYETLLKPPKLYINGFPKSGLHLSVQMVACLFQPVNKDKNWYGTNPWTIVKYRLDEAVDQISEIMPQHYLKGHMGYMEELDQLFQLAQVSMLLVYRDLRDVVVSQTYHILGDRSVLIHPGREFYPESKDEIMMEVITGNEWLPGIMDRWKEYRKWMDLPYVMAVRFGDMVKKPHKVAKDFFDWVYQQSLTQDNMLFDTRIRSKVVELMVSEMKKKEGSTTYRKGKTGQWKREFKPEHVKAFKEVDTEYELFNMGFAKRLDW